MKVAIVHEWLTVYGGADRVLHTLHEIFPAAPIFTLVYNPAKMPEAFKAMDIRTSFIQKLPLSRTRYPMYLPLFPMAVEQYDLSEFDFVISLSHCTAHGAITKAESFHLCYCCSPLRYAWDLYHQYMQSLSRPARALAAPLLSYLRQWDYASSRRVDHYVAISKVIQQRIRKHYGRGSGVLHPPIDTSFYKRYDDDTVRDYFFMISRHVPYKKVDLAIHAFNKLGLPLYIAGTGPQTPYLKSIAGPTIRFLGRISDEQARKHLAECRALVFPQEEDFGLVPVEAQATGRPVIALRRAGALDTVVEGRTGCFFDEQTPEAIAEAVSSFRDADYDPRDIRQHAEQFSIPIFKKSFREIVHKYTTKSAAAATQEEGPQ